MSIALNPPAKSVYHRPENEPLRTAVDELHAELVAAPNWMVRKKRLLDTLQDMGMAFALHAIEEARESDDGELTVDDAVGAYVHAVPVMLAAVLERLGESRIESMEQAAFYLLSEHPEHHDAAIAWLDADVKRMRAFRKFLRANRSYKRVFEMGMDRAGHEHGEECDHPHHLHGHHHHHGST